MKLAILLAAATYASLTSARINYWIQKADNPSADQLDAYARIQDSMDRAVSRYARFSGATKNIRVQYVPGVPTADANYAGEMRFGDNRSYMTERTAMHEISHTLGIGQTQAWSDKCAANNWPIATPLLQSWDGPDAKINCGGGHIWPYGLNYENEWSETNADRHVQLIDAMLRDGM